MTKGVRAMIKKFRMIVK